jgi:hypothetical protein
MECWNPVSASEVKDGGGVAVADPSREEFKRLRAELAEGLGFYPASVAPEDVVRYREQIQPCGSLHSHAPLPRVHCGDHTLTALTVDDYC